MALPSLPKVTLTQENMVEYLSLLVKPPAKLSFKYEINAIALQLIQELKRCREVKDQTAVSLVNIYSRNHQWQQPNFLIHLATLLRTTAELYNDQKIHREKYKEDCSYYAKLRPLVISILSRKTHSLLSPKNEDLLQNTCRYFLLGHNWAGIDTEHVRVKYISPKEGRSGCWEAQPLKWIYPFAQQAVKD